MISIIAGTDRPNSHSEMVALNYHNIMSSKELPSQVFTLESLPVNFFSQGQYGKVPDSFEQVLNKLIKPVDKLIFVIPEYNGSFPGVLKHFIDIVDPSIWAGKRAALVGVATGRAGNLRGLDHFAAVLNYLKVDVYHFKPLLSSIHLHVDASHNVVNEEYSLLMKQQVDGLLKF